MQHQPDRNAASDTGMIDVLPRVVPAPPDKPRRQGVADNQHLMAAVARSPQSWTVHHAKAMAARFDELAASWDDERGGYRPVPLRDALRRAGPWLDGVCVEIGSGTGLLTRLLSSAWSTVVSIDLSHGMLIRATSGLRVRADAAMLPLRDACASAVVIADAPLFAAEVTRILRPEGAVVWSNALGRQAPFWVPTELLIESLMNAEPMSHWTATTSEAGWGSWVVLRRSPPPPQPSSEVRS